MGCLALPLLAALIAVSAASGASSFAFFKTPSGNIGCVYAAYDAAAKLPAELRCDIRSGLKDFVAKRPKGCELDYGDSLEMTKTGRPHPVCHGDTALDPRAPVLAYGKTWTRDGYRCLSRTTGLRCTNLNGHGWFLSRESWSTF